MAKSVPDVSSSLFRTKLQYKCDCAGVWFDEVDEKYSTQTCSCCNRRTGPKGREGLANGPVWNVARTIIATSTRQ
ncbi:zinc ribbon domain-containing protein [Paraburkholderia azotifigens]|uniref:zinc ribbon domain-containing protein n=1 Tax=Paraburkholderia azotifigens TaxID=2057004 RepID=UPI003B8A6932